MFIHQCSPCHADHVYTNTPAHNDIYEKQIKVPKNHPHYILCTRIQGIYVFNFVSKLLQLMLLCLYITFHSVWVLPLSECTLSLRRYTSDLYLPGFPLLPVFLYLSITPFFISSPPRVHSVIYSVEAHCWHNKGDMSACMSAAKWHEWSPGKRGIGREGEVEERREGEGKQWKKRCGGGEGRHEQKLCLIRGKEVMRKWRRWK